MKARWYTAAGCLLVASVGTTLLVFLIQAWAGDPPGKRLPADKPPTDAENRATAEAAKPLLDAIYRFNHQNGLWPNDLDELFPKYVKKEQVAGWRFNTRQNGYWTMINYSGFPHTAVQFRYLKDKGGQWEVSWGDGQAELKVPYTPPAQDKLPADEVNKNLLTTMTKRIERYPGQIIHHKGLVTLLMERELYAEAHNACKKCLEIWPDIWWPNVTLAVLDIRLGSKEEAEKRMTAWVEKHKDFIHYYFLAHYCKASGDTKKALAALNRATELPIIHDWDSVYSGRKDTGETLIWSNEVYLRYAAILAYEGKQIDLCLAVCKRWEKYLKEEKRYGDPGHAIFRAACLVNQGKGAEAVKLIDAVIGGPNYGYQFDPGVKALKKAAQENDSKHVFDPTRSGDGEYGYEKVGNELQLKVTYR
jgi:tetratricopeptide (TPR) repeat protein